MENQKILDIETKKMLKNIEDIKVIYQNELYEYLRRNGRKVSKAETFKIVEEKLINPLLSYGNVFSITIYQIVKDFNNHIKYIYDYINKSNLDDSDKHKYIDYIINKIKNSEILDQEYIKITPSTYLKKIMCKDKTIIDDKKFALLLKKCGINSSTKGLSPYKTTEYFNKYIISEQNVLEGSLLETELNIFVSDIRIKIEQIYHDFINNYITINKKRLIEIISENTNFEIDEEEKILEQIAFDLNKKLMDIVEDEYNICFKNIPLVSKDYYKMFENNLPNNKLDEEIINIIIEQTINNEIKNIILKSKDLIIEVISNTNIKIIKNSSSINNELKMLHKNIFSLLKIDFNSIYLNCAKEIRCIFKIPNIGYTASTINQLMKNSSREMYLLIDKTYINILSKNEVILKDIIKTIN